MKLENRFVPINEIYQSMNFSRWNFKNIINFSLPLPSRLQAPWRTNWREAGYLAKMMSYKLKNTSISRGKRMKWLEKK